jgi:hypothetical protein
VAVSGERCARWKVGEKLANERRQERPSRRIMENRTKNSINKNTVTLKGKVVPVLNYLSVTSRRHMEEWRYSSIILDLGI